MRSNRTFWTYLGQIQCYTTMKRLLLADLTGYRLYGLSVITDNDHVWTGLRQCYLRGYKTAQIDDMGFQSLRSIPASESPRPWPLHSRYNSFDLPESLIDSTHRWNTTALTVIHRDSLLLDWKSDRIPGADTMRTNSFSVAKSLTALAIGAAEKEGLLSVHDRVSKYLPRFSQGPAAELTIEQVLQMRSGIPYGESYKNPFGFMSKCTYGDDILAEAWRLYCRRLPRCALEYQGGNTLLLQEILLEVIDVPLGAWFSDKDLGAHRSDRQRQNGRWTMPVMSAITPASTPRLQNSPDWANSCSDSGQVDGTRRF